MLLAPFAPRDAPIRQATRPDRTPDHGTLTPWRFITIGDGQRDALADLLLKALVEENPEATEKHREKEFNFAHYQGQLVVLVSTTVPDHKIPLWEQQLSCGAAGMNLLLAASAMGYAAGWVTGWRAYSPRVLAAFCAPGERIAGFVFIGHAAGELLDRERPDLAQVSHSWTPPG